MLTIIFVRKQQNILRFRVNKSCHFNFAQKDFVSKFAMQMFSEKCPTLWATNNMATPELAACILQSQMNAISAKHNNNTKQ